MQRSSGPAVPEASRAAASGGVAQAPAPALPLGEAGTLVRRLLLAAGGTLIALPFLDGRLWPLAWLGLAPLFALAPTAPSARSAALDGLTTGFVVNVLGFYWLVATINRFGGFPLPIAVAFFTVLALYGALQFGLVAVALRWAGPGAPLLLGPALWASSEFLFPNLFPWRLAHSQRDLPSLLQTGDLAGPYLLSFVMAWVAAALVRAPRAPRRLIAPLLAVALVLAYGRWRIAEVEHELASAPSFRVGVVQGNLSLDEKRHRASFESNVARYRRLSSQLQPPPDLFVWPETVVEWGIPITTTSLQRIDPYPDAPAPLIFGAVAYHDEAATTEWFNSAFLRTGDGELGGRYDKIILMPFGEFIPFASFFPWLKDLSPNTGDFQAGAGPVVMSVTPDARVGALICYEDLLAGHVRDTVRAGATLLVAITNDAWFGEGPALRQHETLALWRAVENRRYLVRATNTGLSGVIDPLGRLAGTLPTQTATAATTTLHLLSGSTPYLRFGDTFGWFALALASALLIYSRRR